MSSGLASRPPLVAWNPSLRRLATSRARDNGRLPRRLSLASCRRPSIRPARCGSWSPPAIAESPIRALAWVLERGETIVVAGNTNGTGRQSGAAGAGRARPVLTSTPAQRPHWGRRTLLPDGRPTRRGRTAWRPVFPHHCCETPARPGPYWARSARAITEDDPTAIDYSICRLRPRLRAHVPSGDVTRPAEDRPLGKPGIRRPLVGCRAGGGSLAGRSETRRTQPYVEDSGEGRGR